MIRLLSSLALFAFSATLLLASGPSDSQALTARAWLILQRGLTSKTAGKRANAVHALRLLRNNPTAQKMAESALTDPSLKVRAAAAHALGPMRAVSSAPKLKSVLNDKEPAVVLAASHSLFLLGDREEAYRIDYEALIGERKSADGFVESQINEIKDPKAVAMLGIETGVGFMPFGGTAFEVFRRMHKDNRTPVRAAAAKELATDRDPKVDAALTKACSDKQWRVRAAAVDAIASREDPALLHAITPALDDKNDIVRYEASAALLRLSAANQPANGNVVGK